VPQAVEHILRKHEALSSNPSPIKKKKRKIARDFKPFMLHLTQTSIWCNETQYEYCKGFPHF
jgi:hypothetical protein